MCVTTFGLCGAENGCWRLNPGPLRTKQNNLATTLLQMGGMCRTRTDNMAPCIVVIAHRRQISYRPKVFTFVELKTAQHCIP